MGEEIRRTLLQCRGEAVEIITRSEKKINGTLSWLSPDRCMAEIRTKNGEIETIMDVRIKSIKKV
ncbi:hypothetical protein [Ammoniphilus sp. CFH 90114]|uniref:hypothetical protein n=1 Tax=Ammoniphilus sp. CFH 90114 TaxID=2493665 RepID=UPI00100DF935|nr:hypothetical protein [Ammoniphilus sp. CFH 90114]RXT05324.1 hypothetical protein EIZ39_18310 [Ammoniphilus sp. CFH 90114]